jgi:hypothetical protein
MVAISANSLIVAINVLQNAKNTNKNKSYKNFRNSTFDASKNEVL